MTDCGNTNDPLENDDQQKLEPEVRVAHNSTGGRRAPCQDYVPPGTAMQQLLTEIWAEVLNVPMIGVRDNFFDLGGHSLAAIQIVSRIRRRVQADVTLEALFNAPTVEELSTVVAGMCERAPNCPSVPSPLE